MRADSMLRRCVTYLGLGLVAGAVVLLGGADVARAQGSDVAAADALFDEGKQLSAHGRVAEACARFEASIALVPQLGVQLNLADCNDRVGKTASAWLEFGEAAALARRRADRPLWEYALRRQAALRPRLSRIVITVARSAASGDLAVTRDGVRVSPVAYGVEVPVDPGEHVIEASAPECLLWSTRVTVSREGEVVTVIVPELVRAPAPAAPAPAAPAPATPAPAAPAPMTPAPAPAAPGDGSGRRRPTLSTWIATGVGVAGLGLGAYFGLSARSLWKQASPGCDQANRCSDAAFATAERSRRDGELSTAAFTVAGAALVTGVVLYLRSPRERERRVQVAAAISSSTLAVTVAVGF